MANNLLPSPEGAKLFDPIPRYQILAALLAATGWTGGQSFIYNSRVAYLACLIGEALMAGWKDYRCNLIDVRDAATAKDTACAANGPLIAQRFGFDADHWADEIAIKRDALLVHPNSLPGKIGFVIRNSLPELPLFSLDRSAWPECRQRWAKILEILKHRNEITDDAMGSRCLLGGSFARQLHYNNRVCTAIEQLFASWDGKGVPGGLNGNDIYLEAQLIRCAHEVSIHFDHGGKRGALKALKARRGSVLNRDVVDAFMEVQKSSPDFWDLLGNHRIFRDWLIGLEKKAGSVAMVSGFAGMMDVTRLICRAINLKTKYTHDHSDRVGEYSSDLALAYRPDDKLFADVVRVCALLHDTGKIKVPESVLVKPSSLDDDEWVVMRQHPEWGAQMIEEIPGFAIVAEVMLTHHAGIDLNGKGAYPLVSLENRPAGQTLEARIVAVGDTFDAMAANRPYRPNMTEEEVLSELQKHADRKHLDPDIVALVPQHLPKWRPLMAESRKPLVLH